MYCKLNRFVELFGFAVSLKSQCWNTWFLVHLELCNNICN